MPFKPPLPWHPSYLFIYLIARFIFREFSQGASDMVRVGVSILDSIE